MQLVFRAHNKRLPTDPRFDYDSKVGDLIYVTFDGRFKQDAPERKHFVIIDTPHDYLNLYEQDWRAIKALTVPRRNDKLPWEYSSLESYTDAEKTVKHPFRMDFDEMLRQGILTQSQIESIFDPDRPHMDLYIDRDFSTLLIDKLGYPTDATLIKLDQLPKLNWDSGNKNVASSGGDYTSWVTAIDELGDLTGAASVTGTSSEIITENNAVIVDMEVASGTLTLKAGVSHGGVYGGHRIYFSTGYDYAGINGGPGVDQSAGVIVQDLAFRVADSNAASGIQLLDTNNSAGQPVTVKRNVFWHNSGSSYTNFAIWDRYVCDKSHIFNNIFIDFDQGIKVDDEWGSTEHLYFNNTFADCDVGIICTSDTPQFTTFVVKNNLAYHSGTPTSCYNFNNSSPTTAYNVSSDATSPDGATYQDWAGEAAFNNEAGDDFTLGATDSVLDDATDPGTMDDEDIVQNARSTWYIGASEYVTGAETVQIGAGGMAMVGKALKANLAIEIAQATMAMVGQTISKITETIHIAQATLSMVGRDLTVLGATLISIGQATLSYVGQALNTNIIVRIPIAAAAMTYAGGAYLVNLVAKIGAAAMSMVGQAVTANIPQVVQIASASMAYVARSLKVNAVIHIANATMSMVGRGLSIGGVAVGALARRSSWLFWYNKKKRRR